MRSLGILDSAPEAEFDALVRAASLVCDVPISLISLVDSDRQWFKANIGLEGVDQTDRSLAFCAHAIHGPDIFEVADASVDPTFRDNPLVTGSPDIRFYAGAPLVLSDGSNVGTLCVIDRQPRALDARQREILAHLARAAVKALEGRKAAIALHQSEERQRQLNDLLAEDARRRSEFLATLAHELRNPLSALRNASELLKRGRADASIVDRMRDVMDRQIGHMTRLVDDLNEASSVAAGKIQLELRTIDLNALSTAALEASRTAIDGRRHTLTVDLTQPAALVEVDPIRMSQVIANLLVNAAKYTPERGHIALRVGVVHADLVIQVSDDGIGLGREDLDSIFGMFVQAPADETAARSGLGIGLALVQRLVQLHGGTVAATSAGPSRGSTFTVSLPGVVRPGAATRRSPAGP